MVGSGFGKSLCVCLLAASLEGLGVALASVSAYGVGVSGEGIPHRVSVGISSLSLMWNLDFPNRRHGC